MFRFEAQCLGARKRLLNRFDITNFDNVPGFIVNAFFGDSSYRNRLIVCTFGFLNGIAINQLISLIRWRDMNATRIKKLRNLYNDFETKAEYRIRYYSFNVGRNLVMFLNGDIRKFAKKYGRFVYKLFH